MFRDSKLIEYHLKNIFYYFQKYQIFDGFGSRTGNLHIPSPILYRPCYGHLILFVLIQPYLLCNILRAQEGENAKTLKTEKLFFFENGLHGFSMYMLHFIQIRHNYKRKQKRRIITN